MTRRNVCLPMCEHCFKTPDGYDCHHEDPPPGAFEQPRKLWMRHTLIGGQCKFDVGFQVLNKDQWKAVAAVLNWVSLTDDEADGEINNLIIALKKSEKERT